MRLEFSYRARCYSWGMVICLLCLNLWTQSTSANSPNLNGNAPTGQEETAPTLLEPGKPIARDLKSDQSHRYQVTMVAGQYLELVIEQRGIDVSVKLSGPNGEKLGEVNRVKGTKASELITLVADAAGTYQMEIRASEKNSAPGVYVAKLMALRAATSDEQTLETARRLAEESRGLRQEGKYEQAVPLAERALAIRERILGQDHLTVAESIHGLALIHDEKEDYVKAEPLFERALAIREKLLSPDHPDVARSLISLAWILSVKQEYSKSESFYKRALSIQEREFGPEHSEVGTTLNDLALLYFETGDYDQSIQITQRVVSIREKTAGPESEGVPRALNNIALAMMEKGDYAQAEALLRRAVPISEKVHGPDHPQLSFFVDNLARACMDQGKYREAEELYQRALLIREKAFGAEHPRVAESLHSMAFLYRLKGDFARSDELFQRSAEMSEKALGADHRDVATSLSMLAENQLDEGEYGKAEPNIRRAMAIREKARNPQHPEVGFSLGQLGRLYQGNRDYPRAEPLLRQSLAILEKAFGPEQPPVATPLSRLGALFESKGDNEQARSFYERALAIQEKAFGPDHPEVARTLDNLARLAVIKRDAERALSLLSRVNEVREHNFRNNLQSGSERQQLNYLRLFAADTDNALALHRELAPRDPRALRLALTTLLQRKGRGLDAMADNFAILRSRAPAQARELFSRLFDARSQLANLTFKQPDKQSDSYRRQIKQLEETAEKLEAEISVRSAEFRAASLPVTIDTMQAAIPADAALVEFAVYRSGSEYKSETESRYVAYVLKSRGDPQWVDIGDTRAIDRSLKIWRQALRNPERPGIKRLARQVDNQVMAPVRALLGSERHLLISPDSSLNLIPFGALVDEQNRFLVERYEISYLTSGRDLLRLRVPRESRTGAVVVADPAFGEPPLVASRGVGQVRSNNDAARPRIDYSQIFFGPLPGVTAEVRALKQILPNANFLTKEQATKTALRQLRGPSTLHIATHGFFLRQNDDEAPAGVTANRTRLGKWVARVENPLLRSGLALAGANQGSDEGVLTALEAAGLDLWGTKLVVLSACDTGLGDVKNGDGVYGLRRALVLAGAESQVMSLWPVSDRSTADLMAGYYTLLMRAEGRAAALRQVQLRMLSVSGRSHPYYWASFIHSGEWANLQGKR